MKREAVRNTTWDELEVGAEAKIDRTCTVQDLYLFAHVSGNLNPLVLPNNEAQEEDAIAPSMWLASLVSAVLGNVVPGASCALALLYAHWKVTGTAFMPAATLSSAAE